MEKIVFKEEKDKISDIIKSKIQIYKKYISKKYKKELNFEKKRLKITKKLEKRMKKLKISPSEKKNIKNHFFKTRIIFSKKKRKVLSAKNYIPIKIIGRGAFGEVRLCQDSKNNFVAIKKLKKKDMICKNQVKHLNNEKNILLKKTNNKWLPKLYKTFTDKNFLYIVMEYLPGGDLMNLFIKKDVLKEKDAKFYIAEILLAVESLHKMGYIHRDLKPDNILIAKNGHIKLSDFGLCAKYDVYGKFRKNEGFSEKEKQFYFGEDSDCREKRVKNCSMRVKHSPFLKKMDIKSLSKKNTKRNSSLKKKNKKKKSSLIKKNKKNSLKNTHKKKRSLLYSTVGTPDYIAPEVFEQTGYNFTIDFWSLGIILYEMIIGYPPFFSEEPAETYNKILNYKENFEIPEDIKISKEAKDLICKLICDREKRIGIEEIKKHDFFKGFDFENVFSVKPPFLPSIGKEGDTSNFDNYEEEDPWWVPENDFGTKICFEKKNLDDYLFYDFDSQKDLEIEEQKFLEDYFLKLDKYAMNKKLKILKIDEENKKNFSLVTFVEDDVKSDKKRNFLKEKFLKSKKNFKKKKNSLFKKIKNSEGNLKHIKNLSSKKKLSKNYSTKNLCNNLRITSNNGINPKFFNTYNKKLKLPPSKKKLNQNNKKEKKNKKKKINAKKKLIKKHSLRSQRENISINNKGNCIKQIIKRLKEGEKSLKKKIIINIKSFQTPKNKKQGKLFFKFLQNDIFKKRYSPCPMKKIHFKTERRHSKVAVKKYESSRVSIPFKKNKIFNFSKKVIR